MKLVLYGGGHHDETIHLDKNLLKLVDKKNVRISFFPSCSIESELDFIDFVSRFATLGVTSFINFQSDLDFDDVMLNEAFKSDIIYLDGGNTYYFLNQLRKRKLLPKLKSFYKNGGIMAGLSAGAIILTPNILTASIPYFDKDDNEEGISNLSSLNLVNFEFFPHYKNSKRYDKELIKYSKKTKNIIIACKDGQGICVESNVVYFSSDTTLFENGNKLKIKSGTSLNI